MEETRKHLKTSSFVVLLFAGLSLLRIITELLFGELNSAQLPEGAPENTLLITKLILLAVSLLLLLPKVYVGVKGLRIAKKPDSSKGHIIWAGIILAFSAFELIDPAVAIVKHGNVAENVSALFGVLLEVTIYYEYIKYARAAAKLTD